MMYCLCGKHLQYLSLLQPVSCHVSFEVGGIFSNLIACFVIAGQSVTERKVAACLGKRDGGMRFRVNGQTSAIRRIAKTGWANGNDTNVQVLVTRAKKRGRMSLPPGMMTAQLFVSRGARNAAESVPRGRAKHRPRDGAIGGALPEASRPESKCTLMERKALPDDKTVGT